jgi:hypothetical protein
MAATYRTAKHFIADDFITDIFAKIPKNQI